MAWLRHQVIWCRLTAQKTKEQKVKIDKKGESDEFHTNRYKLSKFVYNASKLPIPSRFFMTLVVLFCTRIYIIKDSEEQMMMIVIVNAH